MKKCLFVISAFLLCLSSVFAQTPGLDQIVQTTVNPAMQKYSLPGVAVGVYFHGSANFYNFGVANKTTHAPVTSNTLFDIASISKCFTATLAALDIGDGKMQLNSPVSDFIPGLQNNLSAAIHQVTIESLATHTSSLPRTTSALHFSNNSSEDEFIDKLLQWHPNNVVGTHYLYSNLGYGLLGIAAANVVHDTYANAITDYIFKPLAMSESYVPIPESKLSSYAQGYDKYGYKALPINPTILAGAGGIRSTTTDLMKFMEANLGVLPNTPTALNTAMLLTHQPFFVVKPTFTQALAWQRMNIDGLLLLTKNGRDDGFSSFMIMDPARKIGVVVLTNKGVYSSEDIGRKIILKLEGVSATSQSLESMTNDPDMQ